MSLSATPTRDALTRVFSMFDKTETDVDMSYSTKCSWTSSWRTSVQISICPRVMAMTATRQSRGQTKPYRDSPNPPNPPHGKARDHLYRLEMELSLSTSTPPIGVLYVVYQSSHVCMTLIWPDPNMSKDTRSASPAASRFTVADPKC